ncbi:hypothetical protein ACS229_28030, partial [Klebsiella pneumoniae]|uniref:hypothetical protein n=1 Tax=Klebsiella pneumoniae TaxID=573 RepID=UPI003F225B0E
MAEPTAGRLLSGRAADWQSALPGAQRSVARQHRSTASQPSPASRSAARQPTTKKPGKAPAFSCLTSLDSGSAGQRP